MIVLFTDFGLQGPYLGQVRAVLYQHAPLVPVIDLFADAPAHNPRAAAYLLAAYSEDFPAGTVFLSVIDPGVGTGSREPAIVKADGRWYVGPDNGLFNVIAARASAIVSWHVLWRPEQLSASFHGRDLFAPLAADIVCGRLPPDEMLSEVKLAHWEGELSEVIYVDHFGNLITGIRAAAMGERETLMLGGMHLPRVRTFADAPVGGVLCYENANGLMEIAVNQGRAERHFSARVGSKVAIVPMTVST